MKYKLANNTTNEETLCDKVAIDGFDYYVSDETPPKTYEGYYSVHNIVFHTSKTLLQTGCKKVIATNNPNINIPKVVDEVKVMSESLVETCLEKIKDITKRFFWKAGFKVGYNKSQATHPFSEEDMIEFAEWRRDFEFTDDFSRYEKEELLQLWKEQQPKTVYYE